MNLARGLGFALLAACALPALGAAEAGPDTAPVATMLDDPMRPAVVAPPAAPSAKDASAPPPSYALTAIKLDGPRSYAIVNGTLVRAGDRIDGARVRKIAQDKVDITTDSGVVSLLFNPHEIKRHVDSRQRPR